MSYQEVYNGLNKKASDEQIKKLASIIGMKKKADDPNAPAGVGTYRPLSYWWDQFDNPNEYQRQLSKNYGRKHPIALEIPYLPSYRTLPMIGNKIDPKKIGRPISQHDLEVRRGRQAKSLAEEIFGLKSPLVAPAKRYLENRGAENQKRFIQGTLKENLPTEVEMPVEIPKGKKRDLLDRVGRLMVQNKTPSYSQQIYS